MPKQLKNSLLILACILVLLIIVLIVVFLIKGYSNSRSASLNASTSAAGISTATVTIANIPPAASTASLNGESAITLVEDSTTPTSGAGEVTVSGTVTDNNSCKDLTDVTVKVYTGSLSDCTATNYSTCYVLDDPSPSTHGGCTDPSVLTYSVNNSTINNQLAMEYYALPGTWKATIIPTDHAGINTSGESTSSGTTLNTLTALAVTSTINYGSVSNGSTSTGDHTATVTNTGNTLLDYNLFGENLACATLGSIPVGNEQYKLSSFTYGGGTTLSTTSALVSADISIATMSTVPSTQPSYWQVSVPYSVVGTCSGYVTFDASAHTSVIVHTNPPESIGSVSTGASGGGEPNYVVASSDGTYVYAVSDDNTLQEFNASIHGSAPISIGTVATGSDPISAAISSNGTYVYVVNSGDNTIQEFNTSSHSAAPTPVGAAVATGTHPMSVTVSSDGTYVYVVNEYSNTIQEFNVSNHSAAPVLLYTASTDTYPIAVTVSSDGTYVYVVNATSRTLQEFNVSNHSAAPVLLYTASTGVYPYSVATSPDGTYVYVVNYNNGEGNGTLQAYNVSSHSAAPTPVGAAVATGNAPFSVAVSPDGNYVYVANDGDSTIQEYNTSNHSIAPASIGTVATDGNPVSVAVSPDGNYVYVANLGAFDLQEFNAND